MLKCSNNDSSYYYKPKYYKLTKLTSAPLIPLLVFLRVTNSLLTYTYLLKSYIVATTPPTRNIKRVLQAKTAPQPCFGRGSRWVALRRSLRLRSQLERKTPFTIPSSSTPSSFLTRFLSKYRAYKFLAIEMSIPGVTGIAPRSP